MDVFLGAVVVGLIGYFLFFKRRKLSDVEIKAKALDVIEQMEDTVEQRLNSSHLKDYLDGHSYRFNSGKKNYVRLSERYRHDDEKLKQVMNDWYAYMQLILSGIHSQEMMDVTLDNDESDRIFKEHEENVVRFQEITERFKQQLGKDYVDPLVEEKKT